MKLKGNDINGLLNEAYRIETLRSKLYQTIEHVKPSSNYEGRLISNLTSNNLGIRNNLVDVTIVKLGIIRTFNSSCLKWGILLDEFLQVEFGLLYKIVAFLRDKAVQVRLRQPVFNPNLYI